MPSYNRNSSRSSGSYDSNGNVYISGIPTSNKNYPTSPTINNNYRVSNLFSDDRDFLIHQNIVDRYDVGWYRKFNRFGFIDPYNSVKRTKEYIFVTKPDLNLIDTTIGQDVRQISPFFNDAMDRYPDVALELQFSKSYHTGPFCHILTNAVNGPMELPGLSSDTIETAKNVFGTSISYRGSSMTSDRDFDFSLEFKDSKFLEVYMFFKMYDEYERLKWLGQVSPRDNYIRNRVLHDQVAIYKIITAEDGMTILYWARATGCMPLSVPRDSMSGLDGELTFSVNWRAQFVEDMNPNILIDFNKILKSYKGNRELLPIYNRDIKQADGTWPTCPYIFTRKNAITQKEKFNKYYLVWYA